MDLKELKLYLIKILPCFVLTIVVWQLLGLSKLYHSMVALPLDLLYVRLDPTGFVQGVFAEGKEFVIRILVHGRALSLRMIADDITSNTVLLITLFLASPMMRFRRLYLIHFAVALLILYCIHVFTVAAAVQFAFTTSAEMRAGQAMGRFATKFLVDYSQFYELIGTYLFVLVLWFPYMVTYLMRIRRPGSGNAS